MSGRLTNKRVVLYQRYSTDLQSDRSLADQLHANREFVRREGGDADGAVVIDDAAQSGTSYLRAGFTELLKLVNARLVDAIVTEDLSRLSRNTEHISSLLTRAQRAGVIIYDVMHGSDTSQPGARLTFAFQGLMGSEALVELGHRTRRGLTGRARDGLSTGGRTYGFGSEPIPDGFGGTRGSKITVLPGQAAVVVRMFEAYQTGTSLDRIAFALNHDKVPSPRADRPRHVNSVRPAPSGWSASTVRAILHNPVYIGRRVFNQRAWSKITDIEHVTKTGMEPRRSRKRDPSEFVYSEGPRIIDQDLWDDVQARLRAVHAFYTKDRAGSPEGRAAQPGRPTTHLLSGLLRCKCGASFVLVGGSSAKYYGCNSAKKRGPDICPVTLKVREDVARAAILGALSARLFTREAAAFMREEVARLLGEKSRNDDSELKAHRANRARHRARVDALVDFIAGGDTSEAVRLKLGDSETLLRAEERIIKDLEDAARQPVRLPTPDEVLESARSFETTLMTDPTRGRAMLLQLFEEDGIVLEPQAAGHFVARSRFFPLLALTATLETKTPRTDESPGRSERATALSCAGRI